MFDSQMADQGDCTSISFHSSSNRVVAGAESGTLSRSERATG